jgi:hypothetical protein
MDLPFLFRLVVSVPNHEQGSCQPAGVGQLVEIQSIFRKMPTKPPRQNTDYWCFSLFIGIVAPWMLRTTCRR